MGPQLYRCGNESARQLTRHQKITLQWGRNFIVAEMRGHRGRYGSGILASMGPQLYRCGNTAIRVDSAKLRIASMGPQLYRCGNLSQVRQNSADEIRFNGAATLSLRKSDSDYRRAWEISTLQWGRNFIVAEMAEGRVDVGEVREASMGPQLYRCGNRVCAIGDKPYICTASMGPQLYRCGNLFPILAQSQH